PYRFTASGSSIGRSFASKDFLNVHTDCLIKLLKSSLSARCV
ncbi:MAG: hypothetical protein ACJAT7_003732, partial [Psychromonas sp.]